MKQDRPKILVADDDPDDCLLAIEALLECHREIDIDTVEDAELLLGYLHERIGNGLPGLILLDYRLPRMGGLDALSEIKAQPDLSAIPVAIISSSMPDKDAGRAHKLGAVTVLRKPNTFKEWTRLMGGVLARLPYAFE